MGHRFSNRKSLDQWQLAGSSGTWTFGIKFPTRIATAYAIKRASSGDYSPWTQSWTTSSLSFGAGNSSALFALGY